MFCCLNNRGNRGKNGKRSLFIDMCACYLCEMAIISNNGNWMMAFMFFLSLSVSFSFFLFLYSWSLFSFSPTLVFFSTSLYWLHLSMITFWRKYFKRKTSVNKTNSSTVTQLSNKFTCFSHSSRAASSSGCVRHRPGLGWNDDPSDASAFTTTGIKGDTKMWQRSWRHIFRLFSRERQFRLLSIGIDGNESQTDAMNQLISNVHPFAHDNHRWLFISWLM